MVRISEEPHRTAARFLAQDLPPFLSHLPPLLGVVSCGSGLAVRLSPPFGFWFGVKFSRFVGLSAWACYRTAFPPPVTPHRLPLNPHLNRQGGIVGGGFLRACLVWGSLRVSWGRLLLGVGSSCFRTIRPHRGTVRLSPSHRYTLAAPFLRGGGVGFACVVGTWLLCRRPCPVSFFRWGFGFACATT